MAPMTAPSQVNSVYRIVTGVDFSALKIELIHQALGLATMAARAEIHFLTVLTESRAYEAFDVKRELDELVRAALASAETTGKHRMIERICLNARVGSPAEELVRFAAEVDADVILVGTHNRTGLSRLVLGSVALAVAKSAGCPVVIERPKHHDSRWKVPLVEPPCEDCIAVRMATQNSQYWCERHHHPVAMQRYGGPSSSVDVVRPWGASG